MVRRPRGAQCTCLQSGGHSLRHRVHRLTTQTTVDVFSEFKKKYLEARWSPCAVCGAIDCVELPKYAPGQQAAWQSGGAAHVPPILTVEVESTASTRDVTLHPGSAEELHMDGITNLFSVLSVLYYNGCHYIVEQDVSCYKPDTCDRWLRFDGMNAGGVGQKCAPPTGSIITHGSSQFYVVAVVYGRISDTTQQVQCI